MTKSLILTYDQATAARNAMEQAKAVNAEMQMRFYRETADRSEYYAVRDNGPILGLSVVDVSLYRNKKSEHYETVQDFAKAYGLSA